VIDPLPVHVYTRFLYPATVNGDAAFHVGAVVEDATAYPLDEISAEKAPELAGNNKEVCVPVIAEMLVPAVCVIAKGAVGGVNVPV
jgi:hypothetical protein